MAISEKTKDALMAETQATEQDIRQLWAELKAKVTPADIAQNLETQAKTARATATSHPVATAVLGAGLGAGLTWFLLATPARSKTDTALSKGAGAVTQAMQEYFSQNLKTMRDEAAQVAKTAKAQATTTAEHARDLRDEAQVELSALSEKAQSRLRKLTGQAPLHQDTIREQGQALARQHPVGTVALGLLAGAGLSLLFPRGREMAGAALQKATPDSMTAAFPPAMAALTDVVLTRALQMFDQSEVDPSKSARKSATSKTAKAAAATKKTLKKAVKKELKAAAKATAQPDAKPVTKQASPKPAAETPPKTDSVRAVESIPKTVS